MSLEMKTKITKKNVKLVADIFSKLKTPIKKEERTEVVYKIPCGECNKVYIGKTKRSVKGCISSHKSDISRGINSFALAIHTNSLNRYIDYNNPKTAV